MYFEDSTKLQKLKLPAFSEKKKIVVVWVEKLYELRKELKTQIITNVEKN